LTIRASFNLLAFCVTTRFPREHTFSVVLRSAVAGSYRLEICTGKDSWTRFSSRPDRTAMSVSTFQSNSALSYKGRRCNEFVKSALRANLPLVNINCNLPDYLEFIKNHLRD